MALNETKLSISWIVLSAVFILLSASAYAEQQIEGHRCYWCGPLAEQVHRSQRASTCNGDRSKVTVCDEDLPYCAIVATSPPYIESRFCVKFYQDECYSLFCNSTKTWRITCPCRGELCNGNNTNRETDAFETFLKQNVAKVTPNKRPKRGLISKAGFIGVSTKKNKIDNTTEENKDVHNETVSANIVTEDEKQNANPTEIVKNESIETTTEKSAISANVETTSIENSATTKAAVENNESSEPAANPVENDEAKVTNVMEDPVKNIDKSDTMTTIGNNEKEISEPSIQIDIPSSNIDSGDLKTEIILMSSEVPKLINDAKTNDIPKMTEKISNEQENTPEMKPATEKNKVMPEATTMMVNPTTEANLDKPKKTSEKLPTAEALQHNDTPTTKPTDHMPSSTITMTLNTHADLSTQATVARNNTAVRVDAHLLTIVIGVILLY